MQDRLSGAITPADEIDYETAAANLDLPKDFSKFLK
jgi:hypothetical protein